MSEKVYNTIVSLTATIVYCLVTGAILYFVYNAIAWEFNLPQFGYWVCVGVTYIIYSFTNSFKKGQKTE